MGIREGRLEKISKINNRGGAIILYTRVRFKGIVKALKQRIVKKTANFSRINGFADGMIKSFY